MNQNTLIEPKSQTIKGFTLIELLIVVAIIAILAAIAVPNFIEAQTRAKVSRVHSDMRTMATALESYAVDHNKYPIGHRFGIVVSNPNFPNEALVLERLSTPISYISSVVVQDPFTIKGKLSAAYASGVAGNGLLAGEDGITEDDPEYLTPSGTDEGIVVQLNSYIYQAFQANGRSQTVGDSFQDPFLPATRYLLHSAGPDGLYHNLGGVLANDFLTEGPLMLMYDPTNGTTSFGSVYRAGGEFASPGIASSGSNAGQPYAGGSGIVKASQIAQE